MKRSNPYATAGRLLCFVLVGTAYVLLLMSLSGCGLVTGALRDVGIPIGAGTDEAARQVDAAIRSWFDALIWGGAGVATSEGARATHRVVKKRQANAAAKKQNGQATHNKGTNDGSPAQ